MMQEKMCYARFSAFSDNCLETYTINQSVDTSNNDFIFFLLKTAQTENGAYGFRLQVDRRDLLHRDGQ